MSKFDDFDLDLQAVNSNAPKAGPISANCTATIDSIFNCTRNGNWATCLCSMCCTGHTYGKCSNDC
jgi:hypothetical protein